MKLKKTSLLLTLGALTLLSACNDEETHVSPTIANEALTTVQYKLTNTTDPTDTVTGQWEQLLDNNGNPLPVDVSKANLNLKANSTYSAEIVIWDKTQTPVFNVSDEIKERANYHLFFYQPLPTDTTYVIPAPTGSDTYPDPIPTLLTLTAKLNMSITLTDHDTNTQQYPVGLTTLVKTGAASTGWLRIVLRHQPNVKDGTFAPGSTDLDAGYNVTIK
jgi:hypothetical protein